MGKSKNRSKQNDKADWSLTISIFAVVIAASSLGFSFWTYQESKIEALNLAIENPSERIPVAVLKKVSDSGLYPVEINVDFIFTNIGNRPLSITTYDVYKVVKGSRDTLESGMVRYRVSGLINYDEFESGFYSGANERFFLPINLNVGESETLALKLELHIEEKAYNLLKKNFLMETPIPNSEVFDILFEEEIDIYGNQLNFNIGSDNPTFFELKRLIESGNAREISFKENNKDRELTNFKIEFTTSSGEKISKNFTPTFLY